jgi:soluble lytic murein transglycosylase-like protein
VPESSSWPLALLGVGVLSIGVSVAIVEKRKAVHRKNFGLAVDTVLSLAGKFPSVPPSLALAIIAKESNFNPDDVNETGKDAERGNAWGFMQMTLQTARSLGFEGRAENLLEPSTNVYLGMLYLSRLLRRFDNDIPLAVAAYNRGAEGVNRMLAQGKDVRELSYVAYVIEAKETFRKEGFA